MAGSKCRVRVTNSGLNLQSSRIRCSRRELFVCISSSVMLAVVRDEREAREDLNLESDNF